MGRVELSDNCYLSDCQQVGGIISPVRFSHAGDITLHSTFLHLNVLFVLFLEFVFIIWNQVTFKGLEKKIWNFSNLPKLVYSCCPMPIYNEHLYINLLKFTIVIKTDAGCVFSQVKS